MASQGSDTPVDIAFCWGEGAVIRCAPAWATVEWFRPKMSSLWYRRQPAAGSAFEVHWHGIALWHSTHAPPTHSCTPLTLQPRPQLNYSQARHVGPLLWVFIMAYYSHSAPDIQTAGTFDYQQYLSHNRSETVYTTQDWLKCIYGMQISNSEIIWQWGK